MTRDSISAFHTASRRALAVELSVMLAFCLFAATSLRAQDLQAGRAAVKTETLTVYSQMSTASRVVKSLKKGDAVTVDFEIQGAGQAWCGVIEAGQTKRLGYAPCKDLERAPLPVDPFPPGQLPVVLYGSPSKLADQPPAAARGPSSDDRAPDFTLGGLQGNALTLSSLRGKVVLLDFWASWCGPCRVLIPELERLHRELKGRGLVVVGIDLDEPPELVREFVSENRYTYTQLLDPHAEVARRYQVRYIPTVVIIDAEGKVAAYYWGGPSEQDLRAVLKKVGIQ